MRIPCCVLTCLALAGFLAGCTSHHDYDGYAAGHSINWPYAPASIRVHPITRIKVDPDTGVARVNARIEMLDPDGFSTRGVGKLKLILSGRSEDGVMLMSQTEWECDLIDTENNQRYFDEVTRTYQTVLEMEPDTDMPWEPTLRAILVLPDGKALSDSSRIRFSRPPAPEKVDPAPDTNQESESDSTSITEY